MFKIITEVEALALAKNSRNSNGKNKVIGLALKEALKDSQYLTASVKDLYGVEAVPIANLYRLRDFSGYKNIKANGKFKNEEGLEHFTSISTW